MTLLEFIDKHFDELLHAGGGILFFIFVVGWFWFLTKKLL